MSKLLRVLCMGALLAGCGDDDVPGADSGARDGGSTRDSGPRDSGALRDGATGDSATGDADLGDGGSADAGRDAGGSRSCGGFGGSACAATEFCDYPEGAFCGAADETGVCTPRPVVCDDEFDPVCACDGMTYSNACEAQVAGYDVSSRGACDTPTDCEGCGGACVGTSCDGPWMCDPTVACTDDIAPWCGCDGVTFFGSSTCPTEPWAHRGECEGGVSCDARSVVCLVLPPTCAPGEVPSVEGRCWGRCVPLSACTCSADVECPVGVCDPGGHCGSPP
jgi:hypothetical protein